MYLRQSSQNTCAIVLRQTFETGEQISGCQPTKFGAHLCETIDVIGKRLTTKFLSNFRVVHLLLDTNFVFRYFLLARRTRWTSRLGIFDGKIVDQRQCCLAHASTIIRCTFFPFPFPFRFHILHNAIGALHCSEQQSLSLSKTQHSIQYRDQNSNKQTHRCDLWCISDLVSSIWRNHRIDFPTPVAVSGRNIRGGTNSVVYHRERPTKRKTNSIKMEKKHKNFFFCETEHMGGI